MKQYHNRRQILRKAIPFILGSFSAILVLIGTSKYGVALDHDSTSYVSTARNLLLGDGFTTFEGKTFLHWPPLFPLFLAGWGLLGTDPEVSARFMNSLVLGLIVFLSAKWVLQRITPLKLGLICSVSITLSVPLLDSAMYARSETLFVLFLVLFFLASEKYIHTGTRNSFWLMVLFAVSCSLTRYIGILAIFSGIFAVLLRNKSSMTSAIKAAIAFSLSASLPLIIWLLRNFIISSTFTGPRARAERAYLNTLNDTTLIIANWFLPVAYIDRFQSFSTNRIMMAYIVIIPIIAAIILSIIWNYQTYVQHTTPEAANHLIIVSGLTVFVLLYVGIMIWSVTNVNIVEMSERFLTIVYVPVFLILSYFARDSLRKISGRASSSLILIILTLWLLYPLSHSIHVTIRSRTEGAGGFNRDYYQQESEIVTTLKTYAFDPQCMFLSNREEIVYNAIRETTIEANMIDLHNTRASCKYLIWILRGKSQESYRELRNIEQTNLLVPLITVPDGYIFTIAQTDTR